MARRFLAALLLALVAGTVSAADAPPAAADPAIEARMLRITGELRCLVCQNQTIADSHSDLAGDLREDVRVMLRKGQSDAEVVRFMTDRYGDFVLYRPPVKPTTWLLWFGPGVLMVGGTTLPLLLIRRRTRLADDRFEPDEEDPDQPGPADAALPT
jgi:cytochrome c-type biogenesis protein CcmH